ncbi:MAG TPA: type II CAAX endopeptidase family protein [Rubrobacter sp.]|nr:type II CAAX endopeptidase family protein [Rubrobacter sp.]
MATITAAPSRATTRAFPLKYFVLAFAFTWVLWVPAALEARGLISPLPVPATFLGAFGPLLAAVVVTAQEGGRAGLRSLLGRVVRWRVAPIWYGVAILGPLVITLVAITLHVALGGQPPGLGLLIGALPTLVFVSVYMMITVALGEEVGWRGYALPALQARYSALLASLILGVMWTLWHLPVFFNPDTHYSNLPFLIFLLYIVPFAVLITWVFNSTGGSVLMAMFFHAVMNASGGLWKTIPEYSVEPPIAAEAVAVNVHTNLMPAIVLWIAAIVVVLVYGARDLSRKPRQVPADAGGESRSRVQ